MIFHIENPEETTKKQLLEPILKLCFTGKKNQLNIKEDRNIGNKEQKTIGNENKYKNGKSSSLSVNSGAPSPSLPSLQHSLMLQISSHSYIFGPVVTLSIS